MAARERTRERVRDRSRATGEAIIDRVQRSGGQPIEEIRDVANPEEVLPDLQPVAKVRVAGSITQNLGDYNSVRVGVEIEIPCAPDDVSIEAAYARASEFVDVKLTEEMNSATGVTDGGEGTK